jgi:predicted nucleic acid-binding protein
LDVSCLNRPFDDQTQDRIRLEAEAVTLILDRMDKGEWRQVSSEIAVTEVSAITDPERLARVQALLHDPEVFVTLTPKEFERAQELEGLGFKPADALHVAAAEAEADVFLSCDDRLCSVARRNRDVLGVLVANPVAWLMEMDNAADS